MHPSPPDLSLTMEIINTANSRWVAASSVGDMYNAIDSQGLSSLPSIWQLYDQPQDPAWGYAPDVPASLPFPQRALCLAMQRLVRMMSMSAKVVWWGDACAVPHHACMVS